jgi:hypothetical protein
MTQTVVLTESSPVVLDSSGNGTAKVGPQGKGEVWHPGIVHVSASSHVLEAQCQVFVGDKPTPNNYRDGTLSGSTGDSTDHVSSDEVRLGKSIWAVWTGGDIGATAYLIVTGTKDIS